MQAYRKSFQYALKGIYTVFDSEKNFRTHIWITCLVVAAGFFFGLGAGEWIACVVAIGMVLIAEAVNTAIEYLVDHVSPEQHPAAGKVKDIAAGAVLLSVICAVIIGLLVFVPRLLHLLS